MNNSQKTKDSVVQKDEHKISIHHVLARSYVVYFVLFLLGIYFDFNYNIKVFTGVMSQLIGVLIIIFGSILILWAQYTSRFFNKEKISKETFCRGPYCYTRSPTHAGLFFLMIGFGILANAIFVIIFTLVAFLVGKFFFLNKEEEILADKYGNAYLEYKKIVKF